MTVRRMTRDDLELALDWARAEGWNPGIDDAAAFFAADPDGFFLKEVAGRPAAAVSVVNHDAAFAFLGLYICHPTFRGQGLGLEVWCAGLAHAGTRCVGLDGVPEQQSNYARSGFSHLGRTVRYRGRGAGSPTAGTGVPTDVKDLIQADMQATGIRRRRFSSAWFTGTKTRRTHCLSATDPAASFATFRRCAEGIKIGPFHANNPAAAKALLASVPVEFGDGPLYIDVPDTSPALVEFLKERGFEPVFETARMYSAKPPAAAPPKFYGVATLELG